jgi:hypothetical protein
MDLGLGNLAELKARLLPSSYTQTAFDAVIAQIGRGVASMFDGYCNRSFGRVAGDKDYFTGDRFTWIVNRFPLETVTLLEVRDSLDSGWVTQSGLIINQQDVAGLIQFGAALGNHFSQVRLTYTGGYWYDITEDNTGVMPGTATLLPYDVKECWFLQCAHTWDKRDVLGVKLAGTDPSSKSKLQELDLVPAVKQTLDGYVRFQVTG